MGGKTGGKPAAVHLILGTDSYLAEETLERILEEAIGGDRADALSVFYGDEVRWEQVLNSARSGSLFAARRAVVVRRADALRFEGAAPATAGEADEEAAPEKGRKARTKGEADPVGRYLGDPSPDATVVLLAEKPDRRRNPWKRLSAEACVHSAEPKKGSALRAYVEQELRRRRMRLEADALNDLIDEVGLDLRRLMGEVDKLQAWGAGRDAPLTADDVHAVLGRGLARPLYLLADAAAARDVAGGLAKLEELLDGGEEGLRILVALHRSLRQVRAAKAMDHARVPRAEIAGRLLPPNMQFKLDSLMAAAHRWSEPDLRQALVSLLLADRRIKTGADAGTALVATLVEACEGGRATSPRGGR